jgi:hypothetical protein
MQRLAGAEARDGDVAVYEVCADDECPARREGFNHAHLVEVRRAEGAPDVSTDATS